MTIVDITHISKFVDNFFTGVLFKLGHMCVHVGYSFGDLTHTYKFVDETHIDLKIYYYILFYRSCNNHKQFLFQILNWNEIIWSRRLTSVSYSLTFSVTVNIFILIFYLQLSTRRFQGNGQGRQIHTHAHPQLHTHTHTHTYINFSFLFETSNFIFICPKRRF